MDDVDLVVIAGGGARRLGGVDKAMIALPDGRPLLAALLAIPARRRIVVGPPRDVAGVDVWAREQPPGGGPAAAIAAGLESVTASVVLVVAGDLPFAAGAVPALLAALPGHDVAVVHASGRRQFLLAAWRRPALAAALARLGDPAGTAVRRLFDGVMVADVADTAQWSRDLDTPTDRELLLRPAADSGPPDDRVDRRGL